MPHISIKKLKWKDLFIMYDANYQVSFNIRLILKFCTMTTENHTNYIPQALIGLIEESYEDFMD